MVCLDVGVRDRVATRMESALPFMHSEQDGYVRSDLALLDLTRLAVTADGCQRQGGRTASDASSADLSPRWVRVATVAQGHQRSATVMYGPEEPHVRRPFGSSSWDDATGRIRLWSRRARIRVPSITSAVPATDRSWRRRQCDHPTFVVWAGRRDHLNLAGPLPRPVVGRAGR